MNSQGIILNFIAALAFLLANASTGTVCYAWTYQPKFPEKLRKI